MYLLAILIPLVGGLALLWFTPKHLVRYCTAVVLATAALTVAIAIMGLPAQSYGYFPMGITFTFRVDFISILFSLLFCLVWLCVLRYAFHYMEGDPNQKRFFAFYVATLGALLGVCYANNLVTLYLCFEMVSLCLFSLVAHAQTEESMMACKKYLYYSIGGAFLGLVAVIYFYSLGLPMAFVGGGIEGMAEVADRQTLLLMMALGIVGFGCKAGLFPLHGWLKTAHPIAPAPASAVLSGITTKVGVIAILRLIYFVVGGDLVMGSAVQMTLVTLSLVTIFLGSMLAYREKVLKARLAYSTVSQVSYIIFALLLCNEIAIVGALLHVVFHALAKNSLFLCAGTIIHETGITTVDELKGLGRPLRYTFILFAIASLSLVGVPMMGGFVSKWYIAVGALQYPALGVVGVAVVMISALLTAGYLLTIVVRALFVPESEMSNLTVDTPRGMMSPTLAVLTIAFGIYPAPLISAFTAIAGWML